jgi:hypothetical protein
MNKREFVQGACGALAALASGSSVAAVGEMPASTGTASSPVGLRRLRMPDLATDARLSAWQAYVGHGFRASGPDAGIDLTLDSVAACACQPGFEQFSLSFLAASGAVLRSGTHVLHHATGQRIPVYLEDIETAADTRRRFRADFNLIV